MKILLTGASGAIGGNLLRSGIFDEHEIYCTVHNEPPVHFCDNVVAVKVDLSNDAAKSKIPKVDLVIHAAATVPKNAKSENDFIKNEKIAENLKSYCEINSVKNFIFISTGSVYGKNGLSKETDICEPADEYGKTMLEAENIFLKMQKTASAIVRLFYPFGFDEFTNQDNFIAKLFQKINSGNEIFIGKNADKHFFKPIYIADVASVIHKLMSHSYKGILNVAGNEKITLPELLEKIAALVSKDLKIKFQENIPYPFNADTSLLHTIFKDLKMTPISAGLQKTAAVFQKMGTVSK